MSKIIQISWVSHNAAFTSAFTNLRLQNAFCDVTVCSRGNYFPAHRLILAAFSDYFKEILEETPCKHPFILVQNASGEDLKALLDFIYVGEISVESERMESFLKLAQNLEVRGFAASVKNETQSSIPSPAPPSDFCVNMTELGKRVQNPGVEDSYEVPESPKKNWGPKSKRKRGREPSPPTETIKESSPPAKTVEKPSPPSGAEDSYKVPESYRKNWGPKSKRKRGKETLPMETMEEPSPPAEAVEKPSRPTRTMKEQSSLAKTVKETPSPIKSGKGPLPPIKTAKSKQEKRTRESPPPIKTVKPKEEPLDDIQMTTEKNKLKTSVQFVGKPMVIIEDCPAAIELTRTPKDGKVSVMIAPMENCLTLGDSDDDFFDDDFPPDPSSSQEVESDPIAVSSPKYNEEEKLKCDDVQRTDKRQTDSRNSKRPMPKRAKKDVEKKMDKKEKTEKFSSGTEHDTQEYFQFAVKEEGEQDCQNGNTATTSNHSTLEKREAIKLTFKVKDNNEMVYDIVSPKEKRLRKETPKPPSVFEELAKAGTSKDYDDDDDDDDDDEEVKKKSLKKRKGKKQSFQCQYCPYKTPISVNLRVHLRTHTGEKPFVCSLCPYKSTQSSALRKHMQTHVQNKKVKCPHCEFKTRFGHEELKEHLKSHTDTTTYQCEHCNFITNRYQTLQRHELKNHFKSSSIYIDEDSSSQSKKIVKKCNPYKSRKRSIISKKWMAKRKQKGIPLVAKEAKSCEDNENTNSPTCSRNENRSPESKEKRLPTFDSPKIKSPSFEGFAETKEAPSDACETSNAPSTGTSSSLKTQSCSTSTPTSSTCTISNTPPIQTSESEIANVSTYVTTNTSTTLTTIYSKVVSNTSTTLCLVNAVSLPTVSEFDPLSTNPSVSGIQPFSLQKNNYQSPVILSNSTEEANEEPFLLPKVTNVCGKVPFSSTSTLSTCAERVTDPLQNLNSIASSEFSSPNSNADLNGPSPFVPQTICNESIHKTSLVEDVQDEDPSELTITSVSSGVVFNEEVPCVPCANTSTEDPFNSSDDIIEIAPCVPSADTTSLENPLNNGSEDVEEPQILQITSISTCSDDDSF